MIVSKDPVLAFDIDGVILDWLGGFFAFARANGFNPTCEADAVTNMRLEGVLEGVSQDELHKLIDRFNEHEDFGCLAAYEGAEKGILDLAERYPNRPIVAITSAGTHPKTRVLREDNLKHLPFDEIHILPLRTSKVDHLKSLPAGSLFVEDTLGHAADAEAVGVPSILVRRPYNAHQDHTRIARDWSEIVNHIDDILAGANEKAA